jgi:hypothetical protein
MRAILEEDGDPSGSAGDQTHSMGIVVEETTYLLPLLVLVTRSNTHLPSFLLCPLFCRAQKYHGL